MSPSGALAAAGAVPGLAERPHPLRDAAANRPQSPEHKRQLDGLLQGYLHDAPEALLFFDRRGVLLYRNAHGEHLLRCWNRALGRGQEQASLPAALRGVFRGTLSALELVHPARPALLATLRATPGGYVLRLVDTQTAPRASGLLAKLTPAEQRVSRLVVEGLSSRQIAERLCRSPRTIESQLLSAFQKLGVKNRVQLVRLLS